jgi:hypothetical protein
MKSKSNSDTKTIFKAIFAWEDEKEEKWLEQMAADGWKLVSVAPYIYKFQRSEPEKVVYRLDYKNTLDKDYQEYLTIFKDAGWEFFATFSNWQYFKIKPENNQIPEIFNSGKTKAQKYRRLMSGLIPMLPIYIVVLNPAFGIFDPDNQPHSLSGIMVGLQIFFTVFIAFVIFAVIKIWMKIKSLESEPKE